MEEKSDKNKVNHENMHQKKQYVVLGLGVFGSTVAEALEKYGCKVLAVDQNALRVERIRKKVTKAAVVDITNKDELLTLNIGEMDVAIITLTNHLEKSILATILLKELGVSYVIAKAKNLGQQYILEKMGANKVVCMEKVMGEWAARGFLQKSIVNIMEIDDRYAVSEIKAPAFWHHKKVVQLNVGHVYKMKLLGMKKCGSNELSLNIDPEYKIGEGDSFLVIAQIEDLKKFDYLY